MFQGELQGARDLKWVAIDWKYSGLVKGGGRLVVGRYGTWMVSMCPMFALSI